MERMQIRLISVVDRARAVAPTAGAEIWIHVEFQRSEHESWAEARDRVLAVPDPAYNSYRGDFWSSRIKT